ncbi:MAG: hypothetical protein Ct9H300mP13_4170 [Gammaproteobacteria bacterium]|nr:MAG: hypothetical protein Ct9H300mP13_4170 [Gammaproteobacteria bacterium]
MAFKAFRIKQVDGAIEAGFEQLEINDLSAGEVVVRVQYSGINYKDALAATGKGRITRVPAVNGGVDLVGLSIVPQTNGFMAVTPCWFVVRGSQKHWMVGIRSLRVSW